MKLRATLASVFCLLALGVIWLALPIGHPPAQQLLPDKAGPALAIALLFAGMLGMYVEFLLPGGIVPGVAGAFITLFGIAAASNLPGYHRSLALMGVGLLMSLAQAECSVIRNIRVRVFLRILLILTSSFFVLAGAMTLVPGNVAFAGAVAIPFTLLTSVLFSIASRARLNKKRTAPERLAFLNGSQSNVMLKRSGSLPDETSRSEAGKSQK